MPLTTVLVEDNTTILNSLVPAMAELGGLNVIAVADTAPAAVSMLQEYEDIWELAVVDLFLKQGSGLTVLRACQQRS